MLGSPNWANQISDFRGKLDFDSSKDVGEFKALSAHVSDGRKIDYKRSAPAGLVQKELTKIAESLGFRTKYTISSFRGWAPTCANLLNIRRDDRERLGHWAPGSAMPDRYGKAIGAAELKIRDRIFPEIRAGWRPKEASQVRDAHVSVHTQNTAVCDVDSETSATSTSSHLQGHRISDITMLSVRFVF